MKPRNESALITLQEGLQINVEGTYNPPYDDGETAPTPSDFVIDSIELYKGDLLEYTTFLDELYYSNEGKKRVFKTNIFQLIEEKVLEQIEE